MGLGFISGYWYDASGERVIKTSGDDEGIYVNDVFSGARTMTDNFTAYVNPYLVVSKGGQYTKHIYIGSQRIVSKLGDLDSYGSDPRRIDYAGTNVDGAKVDYKAKYKQSQQTIKDRYEYFEVPYYGKDNDDYVNGGGFCCDDKPKTRSFDPSKNDNPELFQYYYHSDHLGSSSLITNLDGEVVQHIEYVPFGEVFIEERNNRWNTPYLFNAKELDEETGLYYYGARYYDPRVSIWLSTDPMQEKYPNISTYAYTFLNPINFIDPTGMEGEPNDSETTTVQADISNYNFYKGLVAHWAFTKAMHKKHLLDPNWKFDISITSLVGSGGLIRPDAIYDNPGTGIAGVWELKPANPSSSAPLAPLEAKEYAEALNKAANTTRFMTETSGGAPLPFEGEITVMDEYTGYVFGIQYQIQKMVVYIGLILLLQNNLLQYQYYLHLGFQTLKLT